MFVLLFKRYINLSHPNAYFKLFIIQLSNEKKNVYSNHKQIELDSACVRSGSEIGHSLHRQ